MRFQATFPGGLRVSRAARGTCVALLSGVLLAATVTAASADEYVSGYYRSNGAHVDGYYRTDADGYAGNNYSHDGNYNPHTGRYGTHRDGVSSTRRSLGRGSSSHRTAS